MRGIEITPDCPPAEVADLAARAERAGFSTVLASSHYFNRDPFQALDRAAAATDSIGLGPGVVNPYETHPVALASRVATLQEVSGGRAVFGIGAGDRSALRALGIERERPLRRVLETVRVARRLWAGETVTHEGTFGAHAASLKYQPEVVPPVYVGAQGPDMLRMAAVHADGVLFNAAHPDDVSWAADRVAEGLADRPDERGAFDFVVQASVSVAEDADRAREVARRAVAFVAAGADDRVLDRHGIDPDGAREVGERLAADDFSGAYAAVTDPMLDAFAVAGEPAAVSGRLAALLETADGVVVGSPLGPDRATAIDLAAAALADATPE